MKIKCKEIALAFALVFVIPWIVFCLAPKGEQQKAATAERTVPVLTEQGLVTMDIDSYLTGVLLRELPGDFHMQAKMAQAVVARTYTLRTVQMKDKHPQNAVCTDSACCQGYLSTEEYLSMGGARAVVEEAQQAVENTKDWVLIYDGQLIDATYFSCSGGRTEDALAVWGADIPYLQSVESPGEVYAGHYRDAVTFSKAQLQQALGIILKGESSQWFGQTVYTQGGGVESMYIGGKRFSGTTLRSALGLRSTAFSVEVNGDEIVFTTKGFGHRVGMSQYGADAMANEGSTWEEILCHFYTDVELRDIDKNPILG